LRAVVKMALRIDVLQYLILCAETPFFFRRVIQSRTCSEVIAPIFSLPKYGMMCAFSAYT
jgi:hypothetical protein